MKEKYFEAYKIRKVEQSLLDLFGQGLVGGTIHTCVGQEFSGVAVASHLKPGDVVVSNHRCHGHYLAIFKDYEGLIAEILGKPEGVNRGFGGSQHLHREGFYSSGIQGGMVPAAAGIALSNKLKGNKNISISFIGDGTLGQGIVYETFNFISKHEIPLMIVIENNKYSQSTSQSETLAGTIKDRASAFGINYFYGHTNAPTQLIETVGKAIDFIRENSRPVIMEVETYRLNPHSKGDDQRAIEEIENARHEDALNQFLNLQREDIAQEIDQFDLYINEIINKTLKTPDAIVIEDKIKPTVVISETLKTFAQTQTTIIKEINQAFHEIFKQNKSALFLGEDIKDPYGGAFKATKGLSTLYPERVFNMPISEPSIVGISLGASTTNRLVFCEIMFGDFMALAFDQILNHASKMKSMFGKEVQASLVIRTPMGGGRGYGATHSQCLEKHFLGIADLNVFMFHHRTNALNFYQNLANFLKHPAVIFEHKLLYSQDPSKSLPENYSYFESKELYPYGHLKHKEEDADITIVAFGAMGMSLESIINSISDEEIYLDVFLPLDLNSIYLLEAISQSALKTKKILWIEEGTPGYSLSDSLLGEISKLISAKTKFHTKVLTAKAMPLAASPYLEKQILPQAHDIEEAIWELFDEQL